MESVRNCFNDLPNLKKIILCGGEFGITQSFNGSPKLESLIKIQQLYGGAKLRLYKYEKLTKDSISAFSIISIN